MSDFTRVSISIGLLLLPALAQEPDVSPAVREQNAPPQIRQRLQTMRGEIANKRLTFTVGYTKALDRQGERRTGLDLLPLAPKDVEEQNELAASILAKENEAKVAFEKAQVAAGKPALPETTLMAQLPQSSAARFDWSELGKVTHVRDQGQCGSCWAFASVAALESSLAIREGRTVNLSEQFILDAALAGTCMGGTPAEAFTVMMLQGVPKESDAPYKGHEGFPYFNPLNPYRALAWGFCGDNPLNPSVASLKADLLHRGPFTTAIRGSDMFASYTGGVYNEGNTGNVDHVVLVVGWDDSKQAWRIKNSWGKGWGEEGFGWVAYGANRIGLGSSWVKGTCSLFPLPRILREWIEKAQKLAAEAEQEAREAAEKAKQALAAAQAAADRAKAAAERAAADAADKAKKSAQAAALLARQEKALADAIARKAGKQAIEELEDAVKDAKAAAKQASKAAEKAKDAASDAAKDVEDKAKDVAKAITGKVKIKRPKMPKF